MTPSRKRRPARRRRVARPGERKAARSRLLPSRAVSAWAEVQPGAPGVLLPAGTPGSKLDEQALEAIGAGFLFPSLHIAWSVFPEALAALRPDTDLDRVARVFGRAARAFLDLELEDLDGEARIEIRGATLAVRPLQVLGMYPSTVLSGEERPPASEAGEEIALGLVPILVPLAGPLGALVKGAGVLFRAALGLARRRRIVQLAYQRDVRAVGWLFARDEKNTLIDGLHRAAVLLAVERDAASRPGAELRGRLRLAVDLENSAANVFLEQRFQVPLTPYLAGAAEPARAAPPRPRKIEELPLLLGLDEAAALLGLAPAELWDGAAFQAPFAGKFRYFARPGPSGERPPLIDRDSFVRFVLGDLLVKG